MFSSIIEFIRKKNLDYINSKLASPPFYVTSEGKIYAKSEEVMSHPKVQKDLTEFLNTSRIFK